MSRYKKASNDLSDLIELVIKSMFGIVIVYMLAQALLGTHSLNLKSIQFFQNLGLKDQYLKKGKSYPCQKILFLS